MSLPAWGSSATRYEDFYLDFVLSYGPAAEWGSPLVNWVNDGERVLDLGCATGWQARLLAKRGCAVVGVEVDPEAAARATAWCERVVVCDLDVADLAQELAGDSFDAVVAGDVLEHLRDPVHLLRSLASVIRPSGRLLTTIPNVAHGSVRLALLGGSFPYQEAGILDHTHLRFFTLGSIQELFAATGYEIDSIERVSVPIDQGTPYERDRLLPGVEDLVAELPEATTFQFHVAAHPHQAGEPPATPVRQSTTPDLVALQAEALRARDEKILFLSGTVADLEQQLADRRAFLRRFRQRAHRIAKIMKDQARG